MRVGPVTFERVPRSAEGTVAWTRQEMAIPRGELVGAFQAAWVRSVLEAAFGAPQDVHEDGAKAPTSWSYELAASLGERETRLDASGGPDQVAVTFGLAGSRRLQANQEEDETVRIATEAFLDLLETGARADFSGRYTHPRHGGTTRYGVAGGVPWVDAKEHRHDCFPRAGSAWERADRTKGSVLVSLDAGEAAAAAAGPLPTEAEVRAYYAAHVPPGSPALEVLREHVVAALVASRRTAPREAEVRSRAMADVIDDLGNLGRFDFVPLSFAYHSGSSGPVPALRGRRKFGRLAEVVRGVLAGSLPEPEPSPRSTRLPMRAHPEAWRAAADDLEAAARMLDRAPGATFTVRRAPRLS